MAADASLAYVFWHRPRSGVDVEEYEAAQRSFHERIDGPSACFQVEELPFASGAAGGYEDWYLVDGWAGLGALNEAAVDATRGDAHGRAASLVGAGWGGVYGLAAGGPEIPAEASWTEKPRGKPTADFLAGVDAAVVWQRQMVLGPAPEFCVAAPAISRHRVC